MFLVILIIFDPLGGWSRAVEAGRSSIRLLVLHLLPLLLLGCVAEGAGLVYWGKLASQYGSVRTSSVDVAVRFEACRFAVEWIALFLGAILVRFLGNTFHARQKLLQAMTVSVFGLGPVFLLRVFDAFPSVSPWLTWGIGAVLTAVILYQGLPHVMRPDPSHAFGYYVSSIVVLLLVSGLGRIFVILFLQPRILDVLPFAGPAV